VLTQILARFQDRIDNDEAPSIVVFVETEKAKQRLVSEPKYSLALRLDWVSLPTLESIKTLFRPVFDFPQQLRDFRPVLALEFR